MRSFRAVQAVAIGLLVGIVALGSQAEQPKETKSPTLLGKWTPDDKTPQEPGDLEFTKDGKLQITIEREEITKSKGDKGKVEKKTEITKEVIKGTYKVEGDKLALTLKMGDEEHKLTLKIKTLTDKTLVLDDEKGKMMKYRRK